jgi:hypothetical protein
MKLTSRRGSRQAAAAWAALRIALGVAALRKPRMASRAWVGPDAARGLTPVVLGRAAGGRDVALGAGAVACALTGAPLRAWVLAGGGADAVDAVATWLGGPGLPRWRRALVTAVSAASALTAVFLATQVDRRASRLLRYGGKLIGLRRADALRPLFGGRGLRHPVH